MNQSDKKEETKAVSKEVKDEGYIPTELGDFNPKIIHHRNPRTGMIEKVVPIRVIMDNGVKFIEWPKGSGNLWWENRTFAGALNEKGRPVRGAKHMPYTPPLTQDERIAQANMVLEKENKRLALEVEQLRRERELSNTHPTPGQAAKKVSAKDEAKVAKS